MIKAVIFDMFETLITHYNSPLYFSEEMAADAGIPVEKFQALWHPMESDRTIGKITLEELVEFILRECDCYTEELQERIVGKRIAAKKECFEHLHPQIVPMLQGLKEKGLLVGLISNCFSEEATVIRNSELFPYFDVVCLSYELGLQKPEPEIFKNCMERLGVTAEECLYVGDGGSCELEAADALGMQTAQAVWYLKEGTRQPAGRKRGFAQVERPLELLEQDLLVCYRQSEKYACPCCGNYTFTDKPDGNYDICPVCFWEDDPIAYDDPDEVYGCNGVSLNEAKCNYEKFGACREELLPYVREPKAEERIKL